MNTFREPTKLDLLFNLFEEVGKSIKVEDVLAITGIVSYESLRVMLWYMRKKKHIPEENRIDVRVQGGMCIRVN